MESEKFNKIITVILAICIILWLSASLLDYFNVWLMPNSFLKVGYFLNLIALIHIVLNGTFIRNTWSLIAFIVLLFSFGVATIFKLQHWPYGDLIFLSSSLLIALSYTIHFILKKQKAFLDVLKLIWVLAMSSNSVLIEFEAKETSWLMGYGVTILFFVLYCVFAFQVLLARDKESIS